MAKKVVYCKHEKCKLKSHLSLRWGAVFVCGIKNAFFHYYAGINEVGWLDGDNGDVVICSYTEL